MSLPLGLVLIAGCLVLSVTCLALAWRIARQARQLDDVDAARAERATALLAPPRRQLPSAGQLPADHHLAAITWSELRAQQDRVENAMAAEAAKIAADIRAMAEEAEARIPARWRHAP